MVSWAGSLDRAGGPGLAPPGHLRRSGLGLLPVPPNLRAVSIAEGVRAALTTASLVALNQFLAWPPLMVAALAAMLTCFCDVGGPFRQRVPMLLAYAVLGALCMGGFGLLRGAGPAVVLPLACLAIFLNSYARIWGLAAQTVGNQLTVVLVLAIDHALSLRAALTVGGMFLAGSLWAVLVTMVIWRIRPWLPARRAVGEVYHRLARLAADLRGLVQRPDTSAADWEAHARAHRRAVREAIESARETLMDTLRGRGSVSRRGAAALIRLETADQMFSALIALSDLLELDRAPATRAGADRLLRLLSPLLSVLGRAVISDAKIEGERLERPIAAIAAAAQTTPPLRHLGGVLVGRLRIAATLATGAGSLPGAAAAAGSSPVPLRERLLAPLRANLGWDSAPLRHATRAALAAAPAIGLTLWQGAAYGHWLTITLVLTMQPFFALTWQRALERIGGTVLGGLLAAALSTVCTTPLATAVALFPLSVLAFALRPVMFGAMMTFLTPLVVLLVEIGQPGTSELVIAGMRALYTVIGGLLAVASCLVLWPTWEPDRLRQELRAALRAHASWAEAELSRALGETDAAAAEQAARAAGVASNNLEASLSRAMLEPRRGVADGLAAAMTADAALRRLAGRLAAVRHAPDPREGMDEASWRAWRGWIVDSLNALADGAPVAPRPPGKPVEALARMARQIELIDGLRTRLP